MLAPLVWCGLLWPATEAPRLPQARYNNCLKDSYKESGQATWGNAVAPNILRDLYNWISEQGLGQESHHEIFNLRKSDYLTSWPGWSLNSIRSPDLVLSFLSYKNRISFIAVCAWLDWLISRPALKVWVPRGGERFEQVGWMRGWGQVSTEEMVRLISGLLQTFRIKYCENYLHRRLWLVYLDLSVVW